MSDLAERRMWFIVGSLLTVAVALTYLRRAEEKRIEAENKARLARALFQEARSSGW